MVKVVKSEWHQVEKVYGLELDIELLQEIYPDLTDDELNEKLAGIEDGSVDLDEVIEDAYENDIDIDWDYLDQDDWWTDRKGGYEVTYKVEDWKHIEPYEPPKTHKCSKCRWCGTRYESKTEYMNEDGSIHTEDDLEFHHTKEVCPMCDSDLLLTEEGVAEEEKRKRLHKELEELTLDEDDQNVGTPPSDEEFAEQQNVLDEMFAKEDELKMKLETMVVERLADSVEGSAWPWANKPIEEPDVVTLTPSYGPGKYKIELRGRGEERGINKITKTQYEYWNQHSEDLYEALNGDYDYDENKVPKKARFEYEYYNEYCDEGYWFGADSYCYIVITDNDGNEIVSQELGEFVETLHGDEQYEAMIEVEEFYMEYDLKPGYYVYWAQGGKGTYFESEVEVSEGEIFDLKKLTFETIDFEGNSQIKTVKYNDTELENYGGDWSGKYGDFSVHHIQKKK
jgi:hypothetical protein